MKNTGTDGREYGWFRIDNELIDYYQLTPSSGWLYCAIARHVNKKSGVAFPSIATLAKETSMGKSTISKHLDILEGKKLISRTRMLKDDGSYGATHYKLLPVNKGVPHQIDKGTPPDGQGVPHQIDKGIPSDGQGVPHQVETKETNLKETKEKDKDTLPSGKAPLPPKESPKMVAPKPLSKRAIKSAITRMLNKARESAMVDETPTMIWQEIVASQERHITDLEGQGHNPAGIEHQKALLTELQTRDPKKVAEKKAQSRLPNPETMPLYYAIAEAWGIPATSTGILFNMYGLVNGTAKKGEWSKCRLVEPMTVDEIKAYRKWRDREHPGYTMPKQPEKMQQSIERFREAQTTEPVKRIDLNDGVVRASKSVQRVMPHTEKKMPPQMRKRYYENNQIEYDPGTLIRLGVEPDGYVQF